MEGCTLLVSPLTSDLVRAGPGSSLMGRALERAEQCSPPVGHTLGLLGSWAPDLLTSWAPGLLASWSPGLLGSRTPGHLAPRLLPRHLGGYLAGHAMVPPFLGRGATGGRGAAGSLVLGLRRPLDLQLLIGNLLRLM